MAENDSVCELPEVVSIPSGLFRRFVYSSIYKSIANSELHDFCKIFTVKYLMAKCLKIIVPVAPLGSRDMEPLAVRIGHRLPW
jgi:hypothetical protein